MPAPLPVAAAPMRAAPPKPLANAIWNWFGLGVEVAIALLLMPFLIHRLGEAAYGAWIIIGSLTGYLGNLDFGMLSSVGRHLALCHARNDRNGILDVINSAGFAQAMIGMLGLSIVVLISHFLGSITAIPEELLVEAQLALLIGGANLAFSLFLKLFDSALWSNQRFDLLNMVDISAAALRFVLAVTVVSQGYGLVGLACVSFSLTILVGAAKWCLTRFVDREIRFSRAHVRLTTLRKLWSFGVWNTVGSVAGMARSQLSPVVVGATLGVSMVTPYSVVVRLIGMATQFMGAGTGVLVPFSTGLHARNEGHNQQRLFHEASKLCVAAAFYFYALFALLGQSLLTIWIGPELALAWVPLVILASGELIPMSLSMAQVIFLATARNRPAALRSVVECALAISLACVLWRPLGLNGVCLALAVSAALCRGVFGLVQATQIIGISAWEFLTQTFFPVAVAVLPAVGLLALATWDRMPESWPMLFLYTGVFSAIYWISSLLTVFGWSHLRRIIVDR
ncbi:MAG: oligosaccharide flippase family protein [Planctomycetia bacterium]|nr:oligosaccharide flippase family protein [Planctomycetia bacterium]